MEIQLPCGAAVFFRIFVRGFLSELVDDVSQIIFFYCKNETSTRTGGSPWRREHPDEK